ncbi:unnamed protein product [Ilex paraguariensis]|uniref:FBD domain-containing protein n=1 Tax=Ilex paraguariensis TaxID=185542 RepID=A0ABC8RER2_9AQUA
MVSIDKFGRLRLPNVRINVSKVVEFMGFVGRTNDVELVMYLLENAVSLEKMIIDVRDPLSVGKPLEFNETDKKQAARECGRQLKANLPFGAKLEII